MSCVAQVLQDLGHHPVHLVGRLPPLNIDLPDTGWAVAKTVEAKSARIDVFDAQLSECIDDCLLRDVIAFCNRVQAAFRTPARSCSGVTPATLRLQ